MYAFQCPRCNIRTTKDATERIVELLRSAGVETTEWRDPVELLEPHSGPPISPNDLLDFHTLLEGQHWFEDLQTLVQQQPR